MDPYALWVVLALLWALTQLWLLPMSKERWKAADLRQKLARAGSLVVIEKLRDLAAVGTLTLTLLVAMVALFAWLSKGSVGAPQAVIEALASVYGVAKDAADGYGKTLGALGLVGAAVALFLSARHARRRIASAWTARAGELYERLFKEPQLLETARADAELQPLMAQLDARWARLSSHGQGDADAQLSPAALAQTREEMSELMSSLAVEMARKELKFEEAVMHPTAEEAQATPSRWQRLLKVLASERFCKDLGLVRKPLSHVVTGLLLVTLLGWTAEPMANSLQLAVNNLRINVLGEEAQRELGQALSLAQAQPAPDETADAETEVSTPAAAPSVQVTTRLLARAAARDILRAGLVERTAGVRRAAAAETEFVRAALNGQRIEAAPGGDAATRVRSEVADDVARSLAGAGDDAAVAEMRALQQHLEAEFQPHVESLQRQNPSHYKRWAAALENRYGAPMSPLDAQGKLVARMFDEALGGVDAKPSTELGRQAQKLVKDAGKEALKTWSSTIGKSWLADALIDAARPDVAARAAGRFGFETSAESRRFVQELAAAEGHGWAAAQPAQQDIELTRKVAAKVADLHPEASARAAVLERLGGYDGLFPSAPEAPAAGGGGGGGGGGDDGKNGSRGTPAKGFAQARATSFQLASRSFRVRGVLIGQDSAAAGPTYTDLRWRITPGAGATRVAMEARSGARWASLGSFDAGVVNQALRYAADRRVVATTITPGDGKVIGRVTYLHPVLADTPLGCRVVEADRFIDTFSFPSPRNPLAAGLAEMASDRLQFGRWMALMGVAEAVASVPAAQACPREDIDKLVADRKFTPVSFSPAVAAALNNFIATEEKKQPGSTQLLQRGHQCATATDAPLGACLCQRVKGQGLPARYWFPEDHTSQFRERAAPPAANGAWLERTPDRLGHVDLWVHTTFALRKPSDRGADVDEATAAALDFPPAQLQQLRRALQERLPTYVRDAMNSPSYEEFMGPLEEFVLAQRFFRAALAGGLGRDFPLTRLVTLERETRHYVPTQPTIRWEAAGSEPELVNTLRSADPQAGELYLRWRRDTAARYQNKRPMCDRASG